MNSCMTQCSDSVGCQTISAPSTNDAWLIESAIVIAPSVAACCSALLRRRDNALSAYSPAEAIVAICRLRKTRNSRCFTRPRNLNSTASAAYTFLPFLMQLAFRACARTRATRVDTRDGVSSRRTTPSSIDPLGGWVHRRPIGERSPSTMLRLKKLAW